MLFRFFPPLVERRAIDDRRRNSSLIEVVDQLRIDQQFTAARFRGFDVEAFDELAVLSKKIAARLVITFNQTMLNE